MLDPEFNSSSWKIMNEEIVKQLSRIALSQSGITVRGVDFWQVIFCNAHFLTGMKIPFGSVYSGGFVQSGVCMGHSLGQRKLSCERRICVHCPGGEERMGKLSSVSSKIRIFSGVPLPLGCSQNVTVLPSHSP